MFPVTDDAELLEMVPDQTLMAATPAVLVLAERLDSLLALKAFPPIVHAEARCISSLLSTGSITNRRVLRLILGLTPLGEEFRMDDAPAAVANPIIQMQHEIWNNLATMVKDGTAPELPVDMTDHMEDRDRQ